ncbi:uncharacterized protein MAM_08057 [Metarhizium album ARSEF 1941]|uniref:Laccase 1 n=1 Tax=Metarhizium album (strain ARSEF 1941) TaxID=1081103 RepID=A0A0B2WJE7_METAS|nr:uncharacterized protein MAM_08057 [Metarhizium album ARSEF 1941]KHN94048.1 L-ascorbate oxidase, fungi [Metarhizium album ARSEF 1941]
MFSSLGHMVLFVAGTLAELQVHDAATFQPDYVLQASLVPLEVNCNTRPSVALNGTSPGPTLFLTEGKTTWIRVYNGIPDQNLTVHWHGLSQRTAPFSDGTPFVTQWPIPPNHFFDYEINPEHGDAGTYFYHSHVGFQQVTAHGALIVRDALEPAYNYDEDLVMTVADYYAKDDETIVSGLRADPFVWSGEPEAISIQGHTGTANFDRDPSCTPYIIDVEPGKTYRLRVIGATVLSLVKIGIEHHPSLEVIEADGAYTQPVVVDHIQVASGQRFSYLLRTLSRHDIRKAKKTQFWIRYESRDRPKEVSGFALLRYRMSKCPPPKKSLPLSLPPTSPVTLPRRTSDYLEYQLQPRPGPSASEFPRLSEVTRTVRIQVNQKLTTGRFRDGKLDGSLVWEQNGLSWKENAQASTNAMPYLIQEYRGGHATNYTRALAHGGFDPVTKVFPAKVGEVVDIVWENNGGVTGNFDFHPMHLHGQHAYDLGSGPGTYNAVENEKRFLSFTPAPRDTTVLYRYGDKGLPHTTSGWRAWRIPITPRNIGVWMMHCHIAQHAIMGMNTVWAFGDRASILNKFPAPPFSAGYLDFGGSAYGNKTWDPLVNHYFAADNSLPSRT